MTVLQAVAQAGAGRRQGDTSAVAPEKLRAEPLLQLAELQRDRGLAEIKFPRRPPEVAGAGEAEERPQFAQPKRLLSRLALERGEINTHRECDGVHLPRRPLPSADVSCDVRDSREEQ